ncbi:MAG: Na+/H+ antiporter NhaA [Bacteroidota bacterium]|nr:Na+/H+ antiporter NhaA [Bacteroidota bacterium]MDP4215667.1 Na+/H+ antiporter NhaA [Bacteroidota bacterium]MDP4245620.1 Na+/H+ antiporter NhaA [Bacteroidota bacterium]MDP4253037.1 Na+/H+ antiporter NhaA [Bacteroidota bacterium]MDP4260633.1 Na+/H+ antiporter NhaA [Bacteroidota bacterium]
MSTPSLTRIFKEFFASERTGGLLLMISTAISLVIANSGAGDDYIHFWHAHLDLSFAGLSLDYPAEVWINDGLMAVFFLLVGLEIERELYIGELAEPRQALLPILAAAGGMLVPAAIHYLFNHGLVTQAGFGIPMATDIAFTLGVLALLGDRIPASVKIFLTALAIIDDLGAILVIAAVYTRSISVLYLAISLGIFGLLLILNRLNVKRLVFYLLPGIVMWYCMLRSGIHPTISGVLLAFAIPFRRAVIGHPSERLQHGLHKPVAFFILPLFALANTGIRLSPGWARSLLSENSLGVLTGLVLGKPIGVVLFSLLAIRMGWSSLPADMNRRHVLGLGLLAGIGFTMSIFISNLAFDNPVFVLEGKMAILVASVFASLLGYFFLRKRPAS